jgi:ABC-type transport system involved in cytochrome c biogenesis permease subunit
MVASPSLFLRQHFSTLYRERSEKAILISIFNSILPVFYFALVWTYGKAFFADRGWAKRVKTPFLIITVALHFIYLLLRVITFQYPPVTTVFEILSMLAFSVASTYFFIEIRSQRKETGYFILNIAFFFQLASSVFIKDRLEVPEILRSNLFGMHVTSALLGYAAITIAGAYSLMYLMLYHEMKATRFGAIYKKLPNLETLERMTSIAIILAFALLGIAILFGFIWLTYVFPHAYYGDPKLIGTVVVWVIYGFLVVARKLLGWNGRRVMVLSITGFAVSIFSMTIINIFFSGFHKFY